MRDSQGFAAISGDMTVAASGTALATATSEGAIAMGKPERAANADMYLDAPSAGLANSPALQRAHGVARLSFRRKADETRLEQLYQEGCAKIRLPTGTAGAPREAILINTAGGLTGGDQLTTEIIVGPRAGAVVTTQACERIYKSSGDVATVSNSLRVGTGAHLAWLPQETILFNGGRLQRKLDVDLAPDADFLGLEAIVLGREMMGESVNSGMLHDRWRVRRDGVLVFADDLRFAGDIAVTLGRRSVLNGRRAMATLLAVGDDSERLLDPVRALIGEEEGGASAFDGRLIIRLVAPSSYLLRGRLEPIITLLLRGRALPKVWRL